MSENLGSTNIADLVNEDDTDINDDMVDKILNELENTEKDDNCDQDMDFNEMNNQDMEFNNMDFSNENNIDFRNNDNIDFRNNDTIDFRNNDNIELNESDNTVKKINSILVDNTENHILSLNSLITHFKLPLIVFLLVIFLNNSFVTNFLYGLLVKLTKQVLIIDTISLLVRALVSALIIFALNFVQIIN